MEKLQDGTTRTDARDLVSFVTPDGRLNVLALVPEEDRQGDAWEIVKDIADVAKKFGIEGVSVLESPVPAARKKDRMQEVGIAALKAADPVANRLLAHRAKVKVMRADVVGAPAYRGERFWEPTHDAAICARLATMPQPQLVALVRRGIEEGVLLGPVAYAIVRAPAFMSGVSEADRARIELSLKRSSAGFETVDVLLTRVNMADAAVSKAIMAIERAAGVHRGLWTAEAPAVWQLLNEPDLGDVSWLPREYRAAA